MNYNKEELAEMSGENVYRKPKPLVLNEIKIDGRNGTFSKVFLTEEKDLKTGKYRVENLGTSVDVVFMKIRRKLSEKYKPNVQQRVTSEHTSKTDEVIMFGPDSQRGTAADLRIKFPELRTVQVVYAIEKKTGETVRVTIKGASLGSESKAKDVYAFYDYLGSFGKEEHSYEYFTNLSAVQEVSPLGGYYCMTFNRGEKLTDVQMEKVASSMKEVHEYITEQDGFYKSKKPNDSQAGETYNSDEIETIEYPTDDEDDGSDIPF